MKKYIHAIAGDNFSACEIIDKSKKLEDKWFELTCGVKVVVMVMVMQRENMNLTLVFTCMPRNLQK